MKTTERYVIDTLEKKNGNIVLYYDDGSTIEVHKNYLRNKVKSPDTSSIINYLKSSQETLSFTDRMFAGYLGVGRHTWQRWKANKQKPSNGLLKNALTKIGYIWLSGE